jgi:hypothetical protein
MGAGVISSSVSGSNPSLTIDMPSGAYIGTGTPAIATGGNGTSGNPTLKYFQGDIVFDNLGGSYEVLSVTAHGVVNGLTALRQPQYRGITPSNPIACTGGSGTGLTINITWATNGSSNGALALMPSGGQVTAPTPAAGNSSTLVATTAFVRTANVRTMNFEFPGVLTGSEKATLVITQAGTLPANGGSYQAYVGTNPTAANIFSINTIHSGSATTQGTISISSGGSVTWPSFSAVALAPGDAVQIINQGTADATASDIVLALQFQPD